MPETPKLSDVKQALLEKYLRGEVAQKSVRETEAKPIEDNPVLSTPVGARSSLVKVQTGNKRPFFYCHVQHEGGAFYSIPLARYLGENQPFYVLDPYTFDGLRMLPTLEAMAADYIKVMRSVQPEGPYLLGGFCGGCPIAFEIAQQLRAAGQEVGLLVLIEPGVTVPLMPVLERHGPLFVLGTAKLVRAIGGLLRLGPNRSLDMFLFLRHLMAVLHSAQYRKAGNFSFIPTSEKLRHNWVGIFVWILSTYKPSLYLGKVTYFWASEASGSRPVAWEKMAMRSQNEEHHLIAGTHYTCRREHLYDMAAHLQECLNRVQVDLSR